MDTHRTCPNCLQNIPSISYDVHESTCRRHITLCPDCSKPVRNSDLPNHNMEFHPPVPCPQCSRCVPTHLLEFHKTHVCPAILVSCEYCSLKIQRNLLSDHINMCSERTEPCERCFMKVKVFDMKEHRDIACNPVLRYHPPTLDCASPHMQAIPLNTQPNFVSQSDDIEFIGYTPPPAKKLSPEPVPQRAMYELEEVVECDSSLTHQASFRQEPHLPVFSAWTDDKAPVSSHLQHREFDRDMDLDYKLALQIQQQETPAVANTSSDVEYARKLQQEENKVHLTSQIDETLAKQYQQAELPNVPTRNDCYQTLLQAEEQRYKVHESDLELARKLQQEENTALSATRPNADSDVALALKLQTEETVLQSVARPDTGSDIALALTLQTEETALQRVARPDTGRDIALALKLQSEESMSVAPGWSEADMEFARKLQQEENERNRIQAEYAAKDFEMAQKLHEEMNRGNSSLATNSALTTDAVMPPRAEATEVNDKPPEWQEQARITEVFLVPQGNAEWTMVEQKFKSTLSNQIVSISRIQHTWLWDSYCFHRRKLHQKNNGAVNEMELFHGTRQNDPRLIYEGEQGFDMRFSNKGMWGMANYFAVKASYSNRYAFNGPDGCKEMFLAKVLIGESYRCAPDNTLRKPPQKPCASSEQNMLFPTMDYDTVTGETNGSQVFMTYDNCKAYPAYIIKYR